MKEEDFFRAHLFSDPTNEQSIRVNQVYLRVQRVEEAPSDSPRHKIAGPLYRDLNECVVTIVRGHVDPPMEPSLVYEKDVSKKDHSVVDVHERVHVEEFLGRNPQDNVLAYRYNWVGVYGAFLRQQWDTCE